MLKMSTQRAVNALRRNYDKGAKMLFSTAQVA
jgi:hypothetical protein